MKKLFAASGLALALVPLAVGSALAHTGHGKTTHGKMSASAMMYQCQKCHMKMSAATAKKDHYKDPMDGGKLVPMKAAAKGSMGGMKM